MTDHHETRCPTCGGSDEQGCYADCPSDIMPKMQLEIDRLTAALQEDRRVRMLASERRVDELLAALATAEVDAWNAAIEAADAALLTRSCTCYKAIRALRKDTP